ncbi:MAG: CDP-glycerol glycerophosphotransferase family protein, partial [Methanobrevibacter sp.]|nr:CDP-glycerol glycerophosphotransferase family protein [Methanobrevibacter sp.]
MNYFKYKLFAIIFNFFRIFNVNKNRVSFIMPHSANFQGNIKHVYDELNSRGNFKFNFISYSDKQSTLIQKIISFIKTFTINIFYLASSKFIFLNDNFLPMAFMNINPKTLVVQLWHGAGAFKKFGLSSQNNSDLIYLEEKISHKLDLIPVSSKNIAKFYQEAFGVSQDKVLPLGVPRTDFYFNESLAVENIKNKFLEKYPEAKSKKIVLYAPTFREN